MEKLIYDMDMCRDEDKGTCPKFVIDEQTQTISVIDKKGKKANMSVEQFNKFVHAVRTGEITKINTILRK